ncbi:hypothetical protein [Terracidiphilus sp.]|jgi:hypothetical protein|uniref:hypothetical protein n=1 Tax=Terracidiphilus sp. TaxID=1964191 RepID=UPI003C29E0B4
MPDPQTDKSRAAFHQELLAKTIAIRQRETDYKEEDLNPQQIGFLHAKAMLKTSHIPPGKRGAAKVEALRIISAMLGKNTELARKFIDSSFEVIVVPADTPFTALPEFKASPSLVNQSTGVALSISENTSGPSRTWGETRGMGGIQIGSKIYIAVTEENLLGANVTGDALAAGGACYAKQYSTTAHEFAHTIHLHAMDARQKQVIVDCYKRKLKGVVVMGDGSVRCGTADIDGQMTGIVTGSPIHTASAVKAALEVEWVDGPRFHMTPWTSEADIYVKDSANQHVADGGNWKFFKSKYAPITNYAASNAREYWAQLASAYLGCNGGSDPYTGRPRNNSRAWIMGHEEAAICNLLDEVFSPHGVEVSAGSGFGAASIPDSNTQAPGPSNTWKTITDLINSRKQARLAKPPAAKPGNVQNLKSFWEKVQSGGK